ncbi:hypothetical protein GNI_015730 [Gregarina niphandrodes]|uniref:Uncharacterized protein n=1 Tax=Gregarina niphandrodes TaxID=110365 RepID=A0A023BC95_GRENI|nr:hypothetical protein GNI_015730 [Gregarina niphandrodes]EZG82963.1 hypothetical protein GNI_015730 [Gregarina niphandrodes]|eukprot:XP_011128972.1 hypothetical protein GNI_015730 [Gregarina niphandrodes]
MIACPLIQEAEADFSETHLGLSTTPVAAGVVLDVLVHPNPRKRHVRVYVGRRSWTVPFPKLATKAAAPKTVGGTPERLQSNTLGGLGGLGGGVGGEQGRRLQQRLKHYIAFATKGRWGEKSAKLAATRATSSVDLDLKLAVLSPLDIREVVQVMKYNPRHAQLDLEERIMDPAWRETVLQATVSPAAGERAPMGQRPWIHDNKQLADFYDVKLISSTVAQPIPMRSWCTPLAPPKLQGRGRKLQEVQRALISQRTVSKMMWRGSVRCARYEILADTRSLDRVSVLWSRRYTQHVRALVDLHPVQFKTDVAGVAAFNQSVWHFKCTYSLLALFFWSKSDWDTSCGAPGDFAEGFVSAPTGEAHFRAAKPPESAGPGTSVNGLGGAVGVHSADGSGSVELSGACPPLDDVEEFLGRIARQSSSHSFVAVFAKEGGAVALEPVVTALWRSVVWLLKVLAGLLESQTPTPSADLCTELLTAALSTVVSLENQANELNLVLSAGVDSVAGVDSRRAVSLQNGAFAAEMSRVLARYLAPLVAGARLVYNGVQPLFQGAPRDEDDPHLMKKVSQLGGKALGDTVDASCDWPACVALEWLSARALQALQARLYFVACNAGAKLPRPCRLRAPAGERARADLSLGPDLSLVALAEQMAAEPQVAAIPKKRLRGPLASVAASLFEHRRLWESPEERDGRVELLKAGATALAEHTHGLKNCVLLDQPLPAQAVGVTKPLLCQDTGYLDNWTGLFLADEEEHFDGEPSDEDTDADDGSELADLLSEGSSTSQLMYFQIMQDAVDGDDCPREDEDEEGEDRYAQTGVGEESDTDAAESERAESEAESGASGEIRRSSTPPKSPPSRLRRGALTTPGSDEAEAPAQVRILWSPPPRSLRSEILSQSRRRGVSFCRSSPGRLRARSRARSSSTSASLAFVPRRLENRCSRRIKASAFKHCCGRASRRVADVFEEDGVPVLGIPVWHPLVPFGPVMQRLSANTGVCLSDCSLAMKSECGCDLQHLAGTHLLLDIGGFLGESLGPEEAGFAVLSDSYLTVRCPEGHAMPEFRGDAPGYRVVWRCDAFEEEGGSCLNNNLDFKFRPGRGRWRCDACDIDYCEVCVNAYRNRKRVESDRVLSYTRDRYLTGGAKDAVQILWRGYWWVVPYKVLQETGGGLDAIISYVSESIQWYDVGFRSLTDYARVVSLWKLGLVAQNATLSLYQFAWHGRNLDRRPLAQARALRPLRSLVPVETWAAGRPSLWRPLADIVVREAVDELRHGTACRANSGTEFLETGFTKAVLRILVASQLARDLDAAHLRQAELIGAVEKLEALMADDALSQADFEKRKVAILNSVLRTVASWRKAENANPTDPPTDQAKDRGGGSGETGKQDQGGDVGGDVDRQHSAHPTQAEHLPQGDPLSQGEDLSHPTQGRPDGRLSSNDGSYALGFTESWTDSFDEYGCLSYGCRSSEIPSILQEENPRGGLPSAFTSSLPAPSTSEEEESEQNLREDRPCRRDDRREERSGMSRSNSSRSEAVGNKEEMRQASSVGSGAMASHSVCPSGNDPRLEVLFAEIDELDNFLNDPEMMWVMGEKVVIDSTHLPADQAMTAYRNYFHCIPKDTHEYLPGWTPEWGVGLRIGSSGEENGDGEEDVQREESAERPSAAAEECARLTIFGSRFTFFSGLWDDSKIPAPPEIRAQWRFRGVRDLALVAPADQKIDPKVLRVERMTLPEVCNDLHYGLTTPSRTMTTKDVRETLENILKRARNFDPAQHDRRIRRTLCMDLQFEGRYESPHLGGGQLGGGQLGGGQLGGGQLGGGQFGGSYECCRLDSSTKLDNAEWSAGPDVPVEDNCTSFNVLVWWLEYVLRHPLALLPFEGYRAQDAVDQYMTHAYRRSRLSERVGGSAQRNGVEHGAESVTRFGGWLFDRAFFDRWFAGGR